MKKLYLLDVSGFLFRAYFALPPMSNDRGEATHALYGFIRSILKLMDDFGPRYIAAVFDGPHASATRKKKYADYKAHRKPTPEDLPHQMEWAKTFCELMGIPTVEVPDVEADDAMGTIAKKVEKRDVHVYLCSSDKDLAQLVDGDISMLNVAKDNLLIGPKEVEEIWEVRPDQIIDYLAMVGDASDNIPGLPGFGPKTAASLLQEFGTLEEILDNPDKVKGKKKQETIREQRELAEMSYDLATIDVNLPIPTGEKEFRLQEPDEEALQDFYREMRFNTLLRESKPVEKEQIPTTYEIVDDEKSFAKLLEELKGANEVCFDTETTSVRPLEAELVGIGFSLKKGTGCYVPCNGKLGRERVLGALGPLFEDKGIGWYGHNVKYDLHILANYGIAVANVCFDTILASYVLNSHDRRHGLDHLALRHFDKVKIPLKELIGTGKKQITMAEVPIEKAGEYCCEDVDYTLRLKELFEPLLKERELREIFEKIEMPLVPILAKMERNGIYADMKKLEKMGVYLHEEIGKLEKAIHKLAGEPFTINSPKQLQEILYTKLGIKPPKKTKTGYSTAADVLEEIKEEHPICEKILEYRQLEKLRSTYVDALPNEVNPDTGRIHCTFLQWVTATGRLSCVDPNLQNIPVRKEEGRKIREAFEPQEKGWIFLSADYSQIELRLLAHLSGDRHLLEAFGRGDDIHTFTAAEVFGVFPQSVTSEMRHQAKAVNFGLIYGQSAYGLSKQLGIPAKEAARFIKAYFARFDKVEAYLEGCKEEARRTGRAVTLTGRERLIPEITSRNAIQRQAAERLAINTPLQGSSADITKLAMIALDKKLEGLKSKMLLQIHDELIFEVPEEELPQLKKLVQTEMEGVFKLKVPLTVDLSVGKNWKEC